MTNPFHTVRDYLLEQFPWAYDELYVLGKTTTRVFFFLLTILLALTVREVWTRWWRKDLRGEAFEMNQAFAFAALAFALHAAYAGIPEMNWKMFLAVVTTLTTFFVSLLALRLFCASTHNQMIGGNVNAGMRLGLYTLGAGIGSHAVVTAAFSG